MTLPSNEATNDRPTVDTFDILDPLPTYGTRDGNATRRVHVVEASAGTGKTWSIASLVTRLVAETDTPVDALLVVTFTRAAAAELRDRIRARIGEAVSTLAYPPSEAPSDVVLARLLGLEDRERVLSRLRAARERIDLAEIGTIHSFTQKLLARAASDAGLPEREVLVDVDKRIAGLVADYHARVLAALPPTEWLLHCKLGKITPDLLRTLVKLAIVNPEATLQPPAPTLQPAAIAAWGAAMEAFGVAFLAQRAALAKDIHAALDRKALNGNKYRRNSVESNLNKIMAYVTDPKIAKPEDEAWFRYLTKENIGSKYHHPLVDLWETVVATTAAVTPALPSIRTGITRWVLEEWPKALEAERLRTMDGMLRELRDALRNPATGVGMREELRRRFRYVLVDEFQDTDDVQWEIFDAAFGTRDDAGAIWLIGDPKQAIYAFRGADLDVYLAARSTSAKRATMRVNFRTDQELLTALNALMADGSSLAHDDIHFEEVHAPSTRPPRDLVPNGAPDVFQGGPLHVAWFDSTSLEPAADPSTLATPEAERLVSERIAEDIAQALEGGLHLNGRPATARDFAVLVRKNDQATLVLEALRARNVAALVGRSRSVLESEAAGWLRAWLAAMADPSDTRAARTLALTPLFGWTPAEVVATTPQAATAWSVWCAHLTEWTQVLARRGASVALRGAMGQHRCAARLLAQPSGVRNLADLRHLLDLLDRVAAAGARSPADILAWMSRTQTSPGEWRDALLLRIADEADAVTVATVHGAKGLEYGICMVGFAWQPPPSPREREPAALRHAGATAIYVNGYDDEAFELAETRSHEESLRQLYVALTRARHHCVLYAGPATSKKSPIYARSPAAWLLHAGAAPQSVDARRATIDARCGKNADIRALRDDLDGWGGTLTWSVVAEPGVTVVASPPVLEGGTVARAPGSLRSAWLRQSYTGMVHGAPAPDTSPAPEGADHDQERGVAEERAASDERAVKPLSAPMPQSDGTDERLSEVPLAGLKGGANLGTFVHAVLEDLDFSRFSGAPDIDHLDAVLQRRARLATGLDPATRQILRTSLPACLATPLGGPARRSDGQALRLVDIDRSGRLDELRFDIPVLGGSLWRRGGRTLNASAVAAALAKHPELPDRYVEQVRTLGFEGFAGFLNGSIDLVFRAYDPDGAPAWFVADYKTNRVDPMRAGRLTDVNFRPEALAHEMEEAHYHLQAQIYMLALRRYLRARGVNERVGGAYYLFLRGMRGPETPSHGDARGGVFTVHADTSTLDALDAAIDLTSEDCA